jgi:hypothetical protein
MGVTLNVEAAPAGMHAEVAAPVETQTQQPRQYETFPSRKDFNGIRVKWGNLDTLDIVTMPIEDREYYAKMSLRDADFCHRLRTHPNTLRLIDYPSLSKKAINTEVDLRMGALVIAPELMDDETIDNLVQAGVEISKQLGPGQERDFGSIDRLNKVHDILALEALWMARGAVTQTEKVAAKVMLGDSIAESMREIVSLAKRMDQMVSHMDESVLGKPSGTLAEFMLVTWERLNLYMASHHDLDVLGRVFIRSALDREDKMARDTTRSIDAVIMNLDRQYIRPQQYKSGSSTTREYDKAIEVVHIPDWAHVRENIQDVARQFDIILSSDSTGSAKEKARMALNEYFEHSRLASVTK